MPHDLPNITSEVFMTTHAENDILVKLNDESLILSDPSQDIRHRKVVDSNGEEIGHVSDLFVDRELKKVRMLQVAAGGFLGLGDRHFLIPVDAVRRVTQNAVYIDQTRAKVIGSPPYDPKLIDVPFRESWAGYYGYYGYSPYWNPAYISPVLPGVY
jgi:sporulation protein YlmC with PRC-barrel domain